MKILLTNHQLITHAGTEIFTFTLAKALKQRGHDVFVYSAYLGEFAETFREINIPVFDDLENNNQTYDIAHVHHNITAFEIRNRFPHLPMVFMSHGVFHNLEQPPFVDLKMSKFLAISEEVRENLIAIGIDPSDVMLVRNLIDENKYYPCVPINSSPKNALVISNKLDLETEKVIRDACKTSSITCNFVGSRFVPIPNDEMPKLINQHDIVFSLGRGVIEAMLCGRVPIVLDYQGGDGMVTPDNFSKLLAKNFSGRVFSKTYSEKDLLEEINKYRSEYGVSLWSQALKEFSATAQIEKLLLVYNESIRKKVSVLTENEKRIVSSYCESIKSTRKYSKALAKSQTRNLVIDELGGERAFLLFRSLGRLRYLLFPHKRSQK